MIKIALESRNFERLQPLSVTSRKSQKIRQNILKMKTSGHPAKIGFFKHVAFVLIGILKRETTKSMLKLFRGRRGIEVCKFSIRFFSPKDA